MEKSIAMRCNEIQFKKITKKLNDLKIVGIGKFSECPFLVNNCDGKENVITNIPDFAINYHKRKIHKEWNEKIFLEACGIEVKEPKEKTYKITKEQILDIEKATYSFSGQMVRDEIKKLFPEVFETKLEVGKWYKKTWKDGDVDLFPVYEIVQNGNILDKGNYFRNGELLNKAGSYGNISCLTDSRVVITEATNQEVGKALKGHAINIFKNTQSIDNSNICSLGGVYKISDKLTYKYWPSNNMFTIDEVCVFKDGVWAIPVIPTLTIQQAEAKLNCKIV